MAAVEQQPQPPQRSSDATLYLVPTVHNTKEHGATWKANGTPFPSAVATLLTQVCLIEQQVVPHNNIPLVFFGLMITIFLVRASILRVFPLTQALLPGSARPNNVCKFDFDSLFCCLFLACSVSTALPTIVSELGGGNSYSWVGR